MNRLTIGGDKVDDVSSSLTSKIIYTTLCDVWGCWTGYYGILAMWWCSKHWPSTTDISCGNEHIHKHHIETCQHYNCLYRSTERRDDLYFLNSAQSWWINHKICRKLLSGNNIVKVDKNILWFIGDLHVSRVTNHCSHSRSFHLALSFDYYPTLIDMFCLPSLTPAWIDILSLTAALSWDVSLRK